jgi:hypothetical protein
MNRVTNPATFQPNKGSVAAGLMMIDPDKYKKESYAIIKNSNSNFYGISSFSMAYAFYDQLYKAKQLMPLPISPADRSFFLLLIIYADNLNKQIDQRWAKFQENQAFWLHPFIIYDNESQ